LSEEQLRKNKEQLLTDMICAIPESLQLDPDAQKIEPTSKRFSKFIKETWLRNWLRDWFSLLVTISMVGNFLFFLICLGMDKVNN